jgi:hypothetical protein
MISEEVPRIAQSRQEGYGSNNEEQTKQISFFLHIFQENEHWNKVQKLLEVVCLHNNQRDEGVDA